MEKKSLSRLDLHNLDIQLLYMQDLIVTDWL